MLFQMYKPLSLWAERELLITLRHASANKRLQKLRTVSRGVYCDNHRLTQPEVQDFSKTRYCKEVTLRQWFSVIFYSKAPHCPQQYSSAHTKKKLCSKSFMNLLINLTSLDQ